MSADKTRLKMSQVHKALRKDCQIAFTFTTMRIMFWLRPGDMYIYVIISKSKSES